MPFLLSRRHIKVPSEALSVGGSPTGHTTAQLTHGNGRMEDRQSGPFDGI